MMSDDVRWDDAKAASNFAKHGVSFEVAKAVFNDPFAMEQLDDRMNYSEGRFTIIGMVDNRLLFVAFTLRDEIIRIISARAAEPFEKREYHEQNS